ncbi:MAG: PilZ domain-containing protein [Candidatus Omnitrophica bacterium]|nr:PilZ domain-containing protein [Candidatus Omnitrophota bacterium]MBU1134143.1 PilZ domain-containing protein [Candidatus Omnitrophota bacterium]MBU1367503.1 PilZ domain-containing protein [Candidatus Omnitrophota bacterium]MBU1524396.1 PilZ domain-containing protein [Candidatus Omnitrophota bacterium]
MQWQGKERRKFVRVKLPCEIVIRIPQKRIFSTYVGNISVGGVKIALPEKLRISSMVSLDIYAIKKEPVICKGKIVWVKKKKASYGKNFDTGIKFYQLKEKDRQIIKNFVVSVTSK